MAQKQLTSQEIEFISSFKDPIAFFDVFMHEMDRTIDLARDYQQNILVNPFDTADVKAARGVGKSRTIMSDVVRIMVSNPNKVGLITTPALAHLQPLFDKVLLFFNSNKLFKSFVESKRRTPEFHMLLKNGFELYGRIAGVGTTQGTSLLGIHTDYLWLDEGQLYRGLPLEQLQGCLNPNCRVRVFGVPNGVKDTYLAKVWDNEDVPAYCKYKITKFQDPNFTEKEHKQKIAMYGGKNSPSYRNQILAEDDISQNLTFDPKDYNVCFLEYDAYKQFEIRSEDKKLEDLDLPFVPTGKTAYLSGDIGYDPDPSIIGIWVQDAHGNSQLLCKFTIMKVRPSKQVEMIDWLARNYNVPSVAIDAGNIGRSIILDLDKIENRKYSVVPVNFGGAVVLGKTADGEKIKQRIKFYSTVILQEQFKGRKIILPSQDTDLLTEIINSTKRRTRDNSWSFSEPDHNLDMIRGYLMVPLLSSTGDATEGTTIMFLDM